VRHGSITVGLTLVFVGTLLLFNTMGIISWAVWPYLLRWWPVFLIALGLEIVFRRRLFFIIIAVMFLTGTLYYVYAGQPDAWHRYFMRNRHQQAVPLFRWQQEIPVYIEANRLELELRADSLAVRRP
jgi:hypothetical protein